MGVSDYTQFALKWIIYIYYELKRIIFFLFIHNPPISALVEINSFLSVGRESDRDSKGAVWIQP